MKLKSVMFSEFEDNDSSNSSIAKFISTEEMLNEIDIVNYLENGIPLIVCPGPASDLIEPKNGIIGTRHILTDGVWMWRSDLQYYVRKYHLVLPAEFIQHMYEQEWIPPLENEIDFENLDYS
ncbi:hypothetical protein CCAX7_13470 [Capsulimonas corticalis]|uniref:Uncharacterized protein n=1 Tax=Capsulimonas corticalis TaxID=2219043 RepID=A0A402D4H3_9BACT|nr:hypothetical protein [Capsulimonas corticalis]BDI29296.1 hypothetical protein CCAX7_13470 [Capsulimonas corticalis]